jgi:hypothetical protein
MKEVLLTLLTGLFLWAVLDVLSSGRFQLVQGKATYLVDTKTGRVWEQEQDMKRDVLKSFHMKGIYDEKGNFDLEP